MPPQHFPFTAQYLPLSQETYLAIEEYPVSNRTKQQTQTNMFHIDVTFEDQRIVADSNHGHAYDVTIYDNLTGESTDKRFSAQELSYILQFCLHPDGEPEGHEKMYAVLEPLIADIPRNLRPIP